MTAPALLVAVVLAACGPTAPRQAGPIVPSPSPVSQAPGTTPPPETPAPPGAEPSSLPTALPASPPPAPANPPALRGGGLPASLRGVEWTRLPTSRQIVALTFDAGSGAQGLPSILDTLARENVPATFFLTGRWVATYPDLAHRIAAVPGHSIGNHSMDHPDLTHLSDAEIRAQLADAEAWIQATTGRDTHPLFRFPYGASDRRTLGVVNSMGFGSIRWTVDTLGWKGASGGQSVDSVYARALAAGQPGEIVLMHVGAAPDGSTLDADGLPRVIAELKRRGYGFVAIWDFVHGG